MPYYANSKIRKVPSFRVSTGSAPTQGLMPVERTDDLSWRTRVPSDGITRVIPTKTAEPYSWFIELQEFRKRQLVNAGEFDSSKFREDAGHVWTKEAWSLEKPGLSFTTRSSSTTTQLGECWPSWFISSDSTSSTAMNIPVSTLESWAALQYGRMAPGVSEFSLSAFLGELREGLPRALPDLLKKRADIARAAGSDYLNVEFGWKPLLDDLQSLALSLLEASYGLFRPFGANHRRREDLPIESFSRFDGSGTLSGYYGSSSPISHGEHKAEGNGAFGGLSITGQWSTVRRTSIIRSIEGEFVYIPKAGFDPSKYMDRLETLVSLEITPAVLWQLSPWSWMVDWFADIGGAISSMEAAVSNRVLSTYCYAMETTEVSVDNSVASLRHINSATVSYTGPKIWTGTQRYVRKRRVRANPFGFEGTSNSRPTGEKAAILAALGLTRL